MKQTDDLTDRGNPANGSGDLNDNHYGIIIPHHVSELPHIKPSFFFSAQESAVNRCTQMDHLYTCIYKWGFPLCCYSFISLFQI